MMYGNISAGGVYNKDYVRIGDTPLLGISTYADNDIGDDTVYNIGDDTVYNIGDGKLGVIGIDSETGRRVIIHILCFENQWL